MNETVNKNQVSKNEQKQTTLKQKLKKLENTLFMVTPILIEKQINKVKKISTYILEYITYHNTYCTLCLLT